MSKDHIEDAPFIHIEGEGLRSEDLSVGEYKKPIKNIVMSRIPPRVLKYLDDSSIGLIKAYRAAEGKVDRLTGSDLFSAESKGPLNRLLTTVRPKEEPEMGRGFSR